MGGSLKYGQASASLIAGKCSAASRQNTMAAALKEWGILRRTYTPAVRQLRADGRSVPDELLAHISPGHSDNINFFGASRGGHLDGRAQGDLTPAGSAAGRWPWLCR